MKSALVAAALLVGLPLCAAQQEEIAEVVATERELARTALVAVSERLAEVELFRAEYVQERRSPLLVEPLVSKGTLYHRPAPACLVFHAAEPYAAEIRVDARSYQVHRPDEGTAERFEFEGEHAGRALLEAFRPEAEALFEAFYLTAVEPAEHALTLTLRPREPKARNYVDDLELRLDTVAHLPSSLTYRDREGHSVRLALSKAQLDPALAPEAVAALFSPDLPEEVELLVHRVKADQ